MSMPSGTLEIVTSFGTLDLSDLKNYAVAEADGFGMSPLHRISERGPMQHGESDRGYRLDPRIIQLVTTLRAESWEEYYERRAELLSYLSPVSDEALSVRFSQPDGTVRQIDGYCQDGPVFATKDRKGSQFHKAAFRIQCPNPAWYDPNQQSIYVMGGGGGSGFMFPGDVPWLLGGDTIDAELELNYLGTWLEYPQIVITGPIANPTIEHAETGDVLEFDGPAIDEGDAYTIDLRYGYKTIVNNAGVNKISELTSDSDLATWHLRPGVNTIAFSGTSGGSATKITLNYYNRYLGV